MSHSRLIHTKRNLKKIPTSTSFLKIATSPIGDKNQVLMRAFLQLNWPFLDKKINKDISDLCMTLSEIIYICKSEHHQRTPQNLLRRNNLYFVFSILSKSITGVPKKMTAQNFSAATSVV